MKNYTKMVMILAVSMMFSQIQGKTVAESFLDTLATNNGKLLTPAEEKLLNAEQLKECRQFLARPNSEEILKVVANIEQDHIDTITAHTRKLHQRAKAIKFFRQFTDDSTSLPLDNATVKKWHAVVLALQDCNNLQEQRQQQQQQAQTYQAWRPIIEKKQVEDEQRAQTRNTSWLGRYALNHKIS